MATIMRGNVRMAVRSLKRNKMRSFLTMLGVIIGVMSVTLAVGIGEGIKHQISTQTNYLGKDLITIRPGRGLTSQTAGSFGLSGSVVNLGLQASGTLTPLDIDAVRNTPNVAAAAPLSVVSGGIGSNERTGTYDGLVIGTTAQFTQLLPQSLAYGTFFGDDAASANKAIIGSKVAQALFDERVPLGQTVTILGHQFIVSGIFDDFQTTPFSTDANFNTAVFIPYDAAEMISNNSSPIYEILARPTSTAQTNVVARSIRTSLLAAHGGNNDFSVLQQSQTLATTNQILHLVTLFIIGVAAVAFFVGGMGIMNIMLVSITERMHEIGIRKALGATTRQIMIQFITEAAVVSAVGGAIGLAVSFAVEGLLWVFSGVHPMISWQIAVAAYAVAIAIGVLFGSLPALKAAHKEPIAALRNE